MPDPILSNIISFLIVAVVLFFLVRWMNRLRPKACPYCKSTIDIAATRCAHCTSTIETIE